MHALNKNHLKSLQTPHDRDRAVEANAPIHSLFISPCGLTNPFGQKLAGKLRKSGIPCTQLTPPLYRDLNPRCGASRTWRGAQTAMA